jgi:hypothetical protein
MNKLFSIIVFVLIFLSGVSADIISINSGGSTDLIINPDLYLEGFFSSFNNIPLIWDVLLSSSWGTDTTNENLTVTYSSNDSDGDALTNISDWRVGGNSIAVLNMPFDTYKVQGNIRDYSSYENNGTLGGGVSIAIPTWNSSCQVGGCYSFDGDDYVDCGNDNSLNIEQEITISAWINAISWKTNYWEGTIIGKDDWNDGDSHGYVLRTGDNGKLSFTISEDNSVNWHEALTSSLMSTGTWYHIAGTFNGTHLKAYIGGDLKETTVISQTLMETSSYNLKIGQSPFDSARIFNGLIDEAKIYSRALSPEQIMNDYQEGLVGHQVENLVSQETETGETWSVAMTPNDHMSDGVTVLSNSLTLVNAVPNDPSGVDLYSLNGRNESDTDLNCTGFISDPDNTGSLTVEVNWSKNDSMELLVNYTGINNGTTLGAILDNGNLTLGDIWKCSMKVYDSGNSSDPVDSNELEIIDITPPIIYVESPINNSVYTTLDVYFNVSLNEEGEDCLYNLDLVGNVTMDKINDTHFSYLDITLGPGDHDLWYYCVDPSGNWNQTYVNFSVDNEAAISIFMSNELSEGVLWDLVSLPSDDLDAVGNNLNDSTDYYLNVSATNTLVDIYVRADGDLLNDALDILGLGNETYAVNLTDSNVTNGNKVTMTTDYVLIADDIGTSMVYMKFYLDAPASQPAGIYKNILQFKAVRNGQPVE